MVIYDSRIIEAHGSPSAKIYLINEAPGPREASSGMPSYGEQGGNIYRALQRCNISWVKEFNSNCYFAWPKFDDIHYHSPSGKHQVHLRKQFLEIRRQYITCSNAYNQWPKPSKESESWVAPDNTSLCSMTNIQRIRSEISPAHEVLLICGCCAWRSIFREKLKTSNAHIGRELTLLELTKVNDTLNANFKRGFYMGHTSNWGRSAYWKRIDLALSKIESYIDNPMIEK